MNLNAIQMGSLFLLSFIFIACPDDANVEPIELPAPAVTHHLVTFGAGSNWIPNKPIFEQEIGEHFNYQLSLFAEGSLKAAGFLLDNDQGMYLQGVKTAPEIDQIIEDDPAVQSGVFAVIEKEAISIVAEQVLDSTSIGIRQYFLIQYEPGLSWQNDKKLWEQNLSNHQAYMGAKFAEETMMRGIQFINVDRALYIILADDLTAANEIMISDPAIQTQIFSGSIHSWAVNVNQL